MFIFIYMYNGQGQLFIYTNDEVSTMYLNKAVDLSRKGHT